MSEENKNRTVKVTLDRKIGVSEKPERRPRRDDDREERGGREGRSFDDRRGDRGDRKFGDRKPFGDRGDRRFNRDGEGEGRFNRDRRPRRDGDDRGCFGGREGRRRGQEHARLRLPFPCARQARPPYGSLPHRVPGGRRRLRIVP